MIQNILVYIIVAAACLWLMKRFFGQRQRSMCGGGCKCGGKIP